MNLKEAFQAQNSIEKLLSFLEDYFSNGDNLISTTEKHFRSKAAQGQPDEKINIVTEDKFPPDKVIEFLLVLLDEREKLAAAVHDTKAAMNFDLDSAVDVNKKRHCAIEMLRGLRNYKSSSLVEKNAGVGYVFNNEGNQTTYRYDIERVKTIDFDRNKVRNIVAKLQEQADKVSAEIDAALISSTVNYEYPFDMHASNLEILEDFVNR
ncbi:MAG: formate dehydrogenase [Selenomonadaceae bacterium]|nr:formate dehydrogenase [Selenomonadaceae bacterium]